MEAILLGPDSDDDEVEKASVHQKQTTQPEALPSLTFDGQNSLELILSDSSVLESAPLLSKILFQGDIDDMPSVMSFSRYPSKRKLLLAEDDDAGSRAWRCDSPLFGKPWTSDDTFTLAPPCKRLRVTKCTKPNLLHLPVGVLFEGIFPFVFGASVFDAEGAEEKEE
eukprot:CAMPEP_0194061036 /NCGR_PEP_ID=MMETSP0009_2-20130614/73486_1 /TAXON_ID=210454 /ORGANISM="Grammatophora oceanica, Strain CCMP 410" /LENGTH=166 /DNA_ID=CAMNT_0038712193 /DNA_START=135 /DNA_END=632 /DNA_ORIENTATION=-